MNTALNRTSVLYLANRSGQNASYGAVVVLSQNYPNSFEMTNIQGYSETEIGVVIEPLGIANNERGLVAFYNYAPRINLNSFASVGSKIVTSTTGQGAPVSSYTNGVFGIALTSGTNPEVLLIGLSKPPTYQDEIGGRLTVQSNEPLPTGSWIVTGTIYYTPYLSNNIGLYATGTGQWELNTFSEISININSLASGTNYDVFALRSGTGIVFEMVAWSGNNTRSISLARNNHILVRSGMPERRYIGTIRTTGAGVVEDSFRNRFIYNQYNKEKRYVRIRETANSWNYYDHAWRPVNNNPENRCAIVNGQSLDSELYASVMVIPGGNGALIVGIGVNKTNDSDAQMKNTAYATNTFSMCWYKDKINILGYSFFQWVERSNNVNNGVYQDNSGIHFDSGIFGFFVM